jgi:hypothetical protein
MDQSSGFVESRPSAYYVVKLTDIRYRRKITHHFDLQLTTMNNIANNNRNNDHSVLYNNAGVRLMAAGNHNAALELFRGALEAKLTQERFALFTSNASVDDNDDDNMDDDEFDDTENLRCVSPDTSSDDGSNTTPLRGHHPNDNLDSYLEILREMDEQAQNVTASSSSTTTPTISADSGSIMSNHGASSSPSVLLNEAIRSTLLNSQGACYEPYLYTKPFVIAEADSTSMTSSPQNTVQTSQSISCQIVFNLGLIHQMVCRTSCKVASFYEIAATLLSSLPSTMLDDDVATMMLLRIAILNNFGVWCFENGEGESMMNSFEQLVDTIHEDHDALSGSSSIIDPSIMRGVQANIQAFLTPHDNVSLAA